MQGVAQAARDGAKTGVAFAAPAMEATGPERLLQAAAMVQGTASAGHPTPKKARGTMPKRRDRGRGDGHDRGIGLRPEGMVPLEETGRESGPPIYHEQPTHVWCGACGRQYASPDGVRKHCKRYHLAWMNSQDGLQLPVHVNHPPHQGLGIEATMEDAAGVFSRSGKAGGATPRNGSAGV